MKRIIAIVLPLAIVGALAGCSEPSYVTHQAEIVGKNITYQQTSQFKLGDIITAPSVYEVYQFDLRDEDGKIVTEKVEKQDYYDYEIGDTYTYESRA